MGYLASYLRAILTICCWFYLYVDVEICHYVVYCKRKTIKNNIARERKITIKTIARNTRKITTKIARLVDCGSKNNNNNKNCKKKENKKNNVILIVLDRNEILFWLSK